MNATVFLRIAAVILLLHFLGHTVGGVLSGPSHGAAEIAVRQTMGASQFDFMGSLRSYWDFYFGYGVALSAVLLFHVVLLWQLASLARTVPAQVRVFIPALFVEWVAFAIIGWRYFFVAPMVMSIATALCLAMAFQLAGRQR